ncbi:putative cationic amino acid transporter [Hordeum vulgare]|nr:putative cationic amino acid transporter [Hordeum vulgare]
MARRLEWYDRVGLGMGRMLGADVFITVRVFVSALLSFICYAEFAVRVPVTGGAFSYLRVTCGWPRCRCRCDGGTEASSRGRGEAASKVAH